MIYKFRVVSDEVDDFKREIEIDADATFLDLRDALCDAVGFHKDDISSFHICERNWEREKEVTLHDMGLDDSEEVYLMDETRLSDMIEDKGQRLTWVFDYITERALFIELRDTQAGKHLEAAQCVSTRGQAPAQTVDLDEFDSKIDAKAAKQASVAAEDIDDDFYGSDQYNEDEIDLDQMSIDDML